MLPEHRGHAGWTSLVFVSPDDIQEGKGLSKSDTGPTSQRNDAATARAARDLAAAVGQTDVGLFHVVLDTVQAHRSWGNGEALTFDEAASDGPKCSPQTVSRLWRGSGAGGSSVHACVHGHTGCFHMCTHVCTVCLLVRACAHWVFPHAHTCVHSMLVCVHTHVHSMLARVCTCVHTGTLGVSTRTHMRAWCARLCVHVRAHGHTGCSHMHTHVRMAGSHVCTGMLAVSMRAHTCARCVHRCVHMSAHMCLGAPVRVCMCTQLAPEGPMCGTCPVNGPTALVPGSPFPAGNRAPTLRSAPCPGGSSVLRGAHLWLPLRQLAPAPPSQWVLPRFL